MTVPEGWAIVPKSAPQTSEPVPGEVYLTCAASREVFGAFDGCTSVSVTVGWDQRPHTEDGHAPEGLECFADRAGSDTNPVVAVDFLGMQSLEADGIPAELSSWAATCADGQEFTQQELWVPSAGVFLETPDGSIDLADLAPGLDLSGTVPLTWADTLQVTSVDGMNLVGEVMAPVETPYGVIYEATGETSSIPVTLYTECALRATEEAPHGLDERLVLCDEFLDAVRAELETHQPLVTMVSADDWQISVGFQYVS